MLSIVLIVISFYAHIYACAYSARSGYRIQANQDGNPTRLLYYMERELANLDPSQPGGGAGKYTRGEFSWLHPDFEGLCLRVVMGKTFPLDSPCM